MSGLWFTSLFDNAIFKLNLYSNWGWSLSSAPTSPNNCFTFINFSFTRGVFAYNLFPLLTVLFTWFSHLKGIKFSIPVTRGQFNTIFVSSLISCLVTQGLTDSQTHGLTLSSGMFKTVQDWVGMIRTSQEHSGLVRNNQDWWGQVRNDQNSSGLVRKGQD